MSYSFYPTELFISEARKLKKKYPTLSSDLRELRIRLRHDPITGNDALSSNCYKIRLQLTDKNNGKSGGARIIIQVVIQEKVVHFLSIYDKSAKGDLFEGELDKILKKKLMRWRGNKK